MPQAKFRIVKKGVENCVENSIRKGFELSGKS
jgi:hypothetical protein